MKFAKPSTLFVLVALGAWFLLLRPVSLGGPAGYQMVTGTSMEPRLHAGDLVVTQAQDSYRIGQVVVFRVPSDEQGAGSLVVHRLIGGDGESGFITKGDNRPAPDPWHPKSSDIIGRSWVELPGTGQLLLVVRTPLVLATILGGLMGFWFFTSGSGTPSHMERLAGGPTRWLRPLGWRKSRAAVATGQPVASLTPIQDMRERNAQMLARR